MLSKLVTGSSLSGQVQALSIPGNLRFVYVLNFWFRSAFVLIQKNSDCSVIILYLFHSCFVTKVYAVIGIWILMLYNFLFHRLWNPKQGVQSINFFSKTPNILAKQILIVLHFLELWNNLERFRVLLAALFLNFIDLLYQITYFSLIQPAISLWCGTRYRCYWWLAGQRFNLRFFHPVLRHYRVLKPILCNLTHCTLGPHRSWLDSRLIPGLPSLFISVSKSLDAHPGLSLFLDWYLRINREVNGCRISYRVPDVYSSSFGVR